MPPDKYSSTWVSHSSIGNFLKCPRLYYLANMYKDPRSGHRIAIVNPHLSLGVAVHDTLEGLRDFPSNERMTQDLQKNYLQNWQKFTGKLGGFNDIIEEEMYFTRGEKMIETVILNPRFLVNKCVKLKRNKMNPNFFLSEPDNIILNGLIDWLEYLPESNSLHIIDFKTGKREEEEDSLQLPIYLLLCNALQNRKVTKASYWYLESDNFIEKKLPDALDALEKVLTIAKKIKLARESNELPCPKGDGGCYHCRPFELILARDPSAEKVGENTMNQDLYMLNK